jgi:hypothetical protein
LILASDILNQASDIPNSPFRQRPGSISGPLLLPVDS